MERKVLEKSVQTACIRRLKARGAYVYNAIGNAMAAKGTADLLCSIKGRFVAIEVKREHDGKYSITMPQRIRMREVIASGGLAFAVADPSEIDLIVDNLDTVLPCEDWDCRKPLATLYDTSMNGFCHECAMKHDDVPAGGVAKLIREHLADGDTMDVIIDSVFATYGAKITPGYVERLVAFDEDTTFKLPTRKVNGVAIDINPATGMEG